MKTKTYKCSTCPKKYTSAAARNRHERVKKHEFKVPIVVPPAPVEMPYIRIETSRYKNSDNLKPGDIIFCVEKHIIQKVTIDSEHGTSALMETKIVEERWQLNRPR